MTYKPESDLNHNHHQDPNHRYACHNKPDSRFTVIQVQDGWGPQGNRETTNHRTEWLDIGCGHSYKSTDPACSGCAWRDSGP